MSSTHGNLVLPPSRPVAEGGTEDHRSRRAIAPPIASRLSESAFASGPPKVSSPRCSPDAYLVLIFSLIQKDRLAAVFPKSGQAIAASRRVGRTHALC